MRRGEAAVTNTIVIDSFRAALYLNGWGAAKHLGLGRDDREPVRPPLAQWR
jgi:hypothetical protein